jgi:signal transduction histidine kinase
VKAPDAQYLMSRSYFTISLGYVAAYVLLDRISYVHPYSPFGITPWNPQIGLSLALVVLRGPRYLPWLIIASLLADLLVRDSYPSGVSVAFMLVSACGYGGGAVLLYSRLWNFDPLLRGKRDLLLLLLLIVVSAAMVAMLHGVVLYQAALVNDWHDLIQVFARGFIGDLIGAVIFTPFLLIVLTRGGLPGLTWETLVIALFLTVNLWLVFGFSQAFQFQLFYLFFLPVVWIAIRFGLAGASLGLVFVQIGLIAAIQLSEQATADVIAYQALMAVLALTGMAVGTLIDEQRRTDQRLLLQQEALNRAARVGVVGEFAAAVAHEINQPLTAIANYLRLAKRAAEASPPNIKSAAEASAEALAQVDRAGAVVRRLREFIRGGQIFAASTPVAHLVQQTLVAALPELDRHGIRCEIRLDGEMPNVHADALQVQQVLLNVVRNSAEALVGAGRRDGRIVITVAQQSSEFVRLRVDDNGPGFDPDIAAQPITSFTTTKQGGLGLGLSLSRSIVEAHGGRLGLENRASGASVWFTLPVVQQKGVPR